MELPERLGSVGWGVFLLAGGAIAFIFVLIKWISNTDGTKIGIYLGLLSTAGLAVGGYLVAQERGHLKEITGGGGGTPPPTA
jgi:ABC-type Mn2+/Zn2+ transport system permease subunit